MRFILSLGILSNISLAHTSSRKFIGLANPQARKDFCKVFITTPCKSQTKPVRFRRNAADTAAERCQWAPEENRVRRSPNYEYSTEVPRTTDQCNNECQTNGDLVEIVHVETTEALPMGNSRVETTPGGLAQQAKGPGVLILLDETGSMQDLGGRDPATGWGRGRGIIIEKFNQFIALLQEEVRAKTVPDSSLTFVTFNIKAKVIEYDSILEFKPITEADYNPGYGTNLYDSIGCALSEYFHIHNGPSAATRVFIISDGIHQPGQEKVTWLDHELHQTVTKLRDEYDWEFSFYGAMNPEDKAHLKHEAMNLGVRWSETKKFDFSQRSFDIILKSIRNKLNPDYKYLIGCSDLEKTKKNCKKGRRGRFCRARNSSIVKQIEDGECKLDMSSDDDQIM